jgi:omega-amidase
MKLTVSLIQYDIVYGNPQANYEKVERYMKEAVKSKPQIILLPELWTTGYDLTRLDDIADEKGETTFSFLANFAKTYNVNIIAGSIAKKVNKKITNTMLVISSAGELVLEYDKVHLFRLMNEEKYLSPGHKKGDFDLLGIPCSGFICYDIRFPEWIRKHTVEGAKILFVSAEWPKLRIDHWRNLLIARAIENQSYVVACNRVGKDPNNEFGGHSMIVDPWGKVVEEAGENDTIITTDILISMVDEVRNSIPVFEDVRKDLY